MSVVIALFAGLGTGAIVGAWSLAMFAHAVRARRISPEELWQTRSGTRPVSAVRAAPVVVVVDRPSSAVPVVRLPLTLAPVQEVHPYDLDH